MALRKLKATFQIYRIKPPLGGLGVENEIKIKVKVEKTNPLNTK
jgi:hypothetical protein